MLTHLYAAQIYETLSPLNGQVNHNTLAFIRRANIALDKWWADCDELHRTCYTPADNVTIYPLTHRFNSGQSMDDEALPRKILAGELHYAKLWLVCVALRGVSWDKMPFEQRELAFQAKDAASNCISNLLNSPTYRYIIFMYDLRLVVLTILHGIVELLSVTRFMTASSPLHSPVCSYSRWPTYSPPNWT